MKVTTSATPTTTVLAPSLRINFASSTISMVMSMDQPSLVICKMRISRKMNRETKFMTSSAKENLLKVTGMLFY